MPTVARYAPAVPRPLVKLLLPVSAMAFAAGACCCCGEDLTSTLTELGAPSEPVEVSDSPGTPAALAVGSGPLVGACGKFRTLTAAPGTTVQVCTEGGGSDSITMQSKSTPQDSCTAVKAWATAAGYAIEFDTEAMGTWATTLTGSGERMAIACTAATGKTTVIISVTPA